ncbi:MAG TPA: MFS transporter [Acidimicrobiia bacterium]|nr:MFS transporter [Acidimicrobiia bacterium]
MEVRQSHLELVVSRPPRSERLFRSPRWLQQLNNNMRSLYLVAGTTMAGVSSVFALLAEIHNTYDIAERDLGWIAGSAFVGALVTQLSLSRYADRGHGGLLMRLGVIASTTGLLWFGFADELWQFIAARAVLGTGVGVIVPAARRFIIVTAGADQGRQLGAFYGAYLAGFVIGPPLAGALTVAFDVRAPFLVLGMVTGLTFLSIRRLEIPAADVTVRSTKGVLRRLIRSREMVAALLVVVSFRYSVGVFEPLWAPHLDNLGASTMIVTLSLSAFALPMLVIARWAGGLSDRHSPRLTSLLSALATVPLMASYGWITAVPVLFVAMLPHGIMEAIQSPGSQSAVANAAPVDDAASAQGLGEAMGSAASMVGALTAAPLYAWLGPGPAFLIAALTMGGLLGLSWLLDPPPLEKQR